MNLGGQRLCLCFLAAGWGLVGCAHEREEVDSRPLGNNLSSTLPQDRTKVSRYNRKTYEGKGFGTKSYRTRQSAVGKRFKPRSEEFAVDARQTADYGSKESPLAGKASPHADDRARTKGFAGADRVAPTEGYAEASRGFETGRASGEGQRYHSAKVRRVNRTARRAQERSIRADDITVADLPGGSAASGAVVPVEGSNRKAVRPSLRSPHDPASGTTLSAEEVRRILNRGQRPD